MPTSQNSFVPSSYQKPPVHYGYILLPEPFLKEEHEAQSRGDNELPYWHERYQMIELIGSRSSHSSLAQINKRRQKRYKKSRQQQPQKLVETTKLDYRVIWIEVGLPLLMVPFTLWVMILIIGGVLAQLHLPPESERKVMAPVA